MAFVVFVDVEPSATIEIAAGFGRGAQATIEIAAGFGRGAQATIEIAAGFCRGAQATIEIAAGFVEERCDHTRSVQGLEMLTLLSMLSLQRPLSKNSGLCR